MLESTFSTPNVVSTHSRPKAAVVAILYKINWQCFNTQPPEGGCTVDLRGNILLVFQHTAARRRLAITDAVVAAKEVSTHSRPKAAEHGLGFGFAVFGFNTQPPEGGCGKPRQKSTN